MADNSTLPLTGTGDSTSVVATKEVTHAGDTAVIQVLHLVSVTGSEGSYTVNEITDANGMQIQGAAAENAAVAGNPLLTGGRYDASARTLGDGDVGAVALDASGHVITSPHADSVALSDNLSNTVNIETDHSGGFIGAGVFPFYFDGSTWDRVRGDSSNGLLVNLGANNDVTISSGTITTITNDVNIADGGNSITVDWAGTAPPIGAGVEATALRVTLATDSTGVLSVDDNGGSLTIDNADITTIAGAVSGSEMQVDIVSGNVTNAGTFAVQEDGAALTALQLLDDTVFVDDTSTHATGTTKLLGIGAAATPTDTSIDANDIGMLAMSTDRRLLVDSQIVGQDADVTIADGGNMISVDDGGSTLSIDDGGGNISIDWAGTSPPIGAGTEAAALRVTVATDSTGVLTVDNAGTFATQPTLQAGTAIAGKMYITDGTDDATVRDVTGAKALDVSIVDGSGTQITSFGGGTQYAVDTAAGGTDTGTVALAVRDDVLTTLTPADGDYVSLRTNSTGALHVTGSSGNAVVVTNAIDSTAFDLNAAPFSTASSISTDYILDSIELNFSTAESKTITITTADGTQLYKDTNTSQHVSITEIDRAFNGGENFTVAVTQFGSAGTMDCIAIVKEASAVIGASPVIGTGTNEIGTVYVKMADSPSLDAFGRVRTSTPTTLFDSKLLAADDQPLFWDESLETGSGITASTPTAAKPYIDFTSTISTAGKFTRQTFQRFNYQPGKSQLILITGVLDLSGGGTGVERRIGYFDDDNGAFFEDDAGTIGVTVRSNDSGTPADTTVTQASWNLDVMDGTGASGITVDWTKSQIMVIDFQWLSIGRIRFGLEISGVLTYVHQTSQANTSVLPWASTPNLPIRYQMITTGSSPASTMRAICSAVISEGGQDAKGLTHSHATADHVNANTADTVYALLGVRLKAAQVGCGFEAVNVSVLSETADDFEWQLIHNATVAGTFAYSDKTNSCTQTATGSTANPSTNTVTNGTIITRGFGTSSSAIELSLDSTLSLGVSIGGTLDTLVLAVRPLGSNADIQGALTWRELA